MVPEARGELGRGHLCRYKRVREYSTKKCRMECWHNKRLPVISGRLKSWSIVIVRHSSALFTTSWEIMTRRVIFYNSACTRRFKRYHPNFEQSFFYAMQAN